MDNFVPNATVVVTGGDSTMHFNDTTIARLDTSRFSFPLRAYACRPFVLQSGRQYEISVQTKEFGATVGNVTVPAKSLLAWGAGAEDVLSYPGSHQPEAEIPCQVLLSEVVEGYIARLSPALSNSFV